MKNGDRRKGSETRRGSKAFLDDNHREDNTRGNGEWWMFDDGVGSKINLIPSEISGGRNAGRN